MRGVGSEDRQGWEGEEGETLKDTCIQYPCLLLKALAEYDLQLLRRLCCSTLREGIHAQVTSQRGSGAPGEKGKLHISGVTLLVRSALVEATGSPVCFTQVKVTGFFPALFTHVKITGREISRGSIREQRNG